jgi:hypothetical protein
MRSVFLRLFRMQDCQAKLSARSLLQGDRKSVHLLVPRNEGPQKCTPTRCRLVLLVQFDACLDCAGIALIFARLRRH